MHHPQYIGLLPDRARVYILNQYGPEEARLTQEQLRANHPGWSFDSINEDGAFARLLWAHYLGLDRVACADEAGKTLSREVEKGEERRNLARQALSNPDLLALLTTREVAVLARRFLPTPGATLQEIGESLGVTKERVRGIISAALDKVRA